MGCCAPVQAVALRALREEEDAQRAKRAAAFRAAPAPAHPPPRAPRRSAQPPTRAHTPNLALRSRSAARTAFDAGVAERQRAQEVRPRGQCLLDKIFRAKDRRQGPWPLAELARAPGCC